MKKFFFFSLAIVVWAGAFAQIRLSGFVRDAETKNPIPNVVIQIIETGQTKETNASGTFEFTLAKPGTYTANYMLVGFIKKTEEIYIEEGKSEARVLVDLIPEKTMLQPVEVSALRAGESAPIAYENVGKEELKKLNTGRDLPYLLEQTPSVVTTSDAGAGIGYTNMRVRGSDITRINVTVNGIPINDAESHGVFWVNMPDLSSTTNSIQLQRGVGTSTNGSAAFGASLNMETESPPQKPFGILNFGAGSFNTQRFTAQFGTGLLNKNWWVSGRLSKIKSDGYVDRATSDLTSHYLSGGFINERTSVRAVAFGGKEITYQSWNGVDSATMATNRTFNSAGAIYDDQWNVLGFYKDEVDHYGQDHYQLHINQVLRKHIKLNASLNYTKGSGYYEQIRQDEDFASYNLDTLFIGGDTILNTDLVRRKWLDNDFYGGILNLEFTNDFMTSIIGGGYFQYEGNHFGEVVWAEFGATDPNRNPYYKSYSNKRDWNVYWKNLIDINYSVTAFVDLQIRGVNYSAAGSDDDVGTFSFSQDNLFFNPKAGITYRVDDRDKVFISYAMAHKEPNRTDLIYADPEKLPKPEELHDFELGYDFKGEKLQIKGNAFYMFYVNQLVLTGELDNVGYPIRRNVGKSYRIGVELAFSWRPVKWLRWSPNVTYMQSQNLDYIEDFGNDTLKALGNTAIAYSPNLIFASTMEFFPITGLSIAWFSKYVDRQYLSNNESEQLTLDAYFLNDIRVTYDLNPKWIDSIRLYAGIYNAFNVQYASNGYVWGSTPYFYPQAGANFLAGITVSF